MAGGLTAGAGDPTLPRDMHDPTQLPQDLPTPIDDGAADHLRGAVLPDLSLMSTSGRLEQLSELARTPLVLFFYPRTGIPGEPPSLGFAGETWESIPGARGCTPQSCGFRDLYGAFREQGVDVFGVSTNTTAHQRAFRSRMRVPFDLLSDSDLELVRRMRLPTFEFPVESGSPTTLIRRMAWYCERGVVGQVWYPVFPPDQNARVVLDWLAGRGR